jgi:outer membrane protein OmpA-like peptidoglycan-associated protein
LSCYNQGQSLVKQKLLIYNPFSGKPIQASFSWSKDDNKTSIKKLENGVYEMQFQDNDPGELTITSDGYFDSILKLSADSARRRPLREIKLQPGIPQLFISIVSNETEETVTSDIDLFTMDESSIVFSEEVEVSPYTIDLEYNKVHVLQVRSPGFFSFKDTIDFTGVYEGKVRERVIRLVPLRAGNKISLHNIHFKPNDSHLTDFAQLMLVELTHILEQEKGIVLEVGAYTDDVGTEEYNLMLSEKRASAVKRYLVEKGAAEKQIITKGYGESSPLAENSSDENRALNRRVEFKIMSIN